MSHIILYILVTNNIWEASIVTKETIWFKMNQLEKNHIRLLFQPDKDQIIVLFHVIQKAEIILAKSYKKACIKTLYGKSSGN